MKRVTFNRTFIRITNKRFRKRQVRKKLKKVLKRRAEEQKRSYASIRKNRLKLRIKADNDRYIEIVPPADFSIVNNPNETLEFFLNIQNLILKFNPVSVNMSGIREMTVDALVYYIAILQSLRQRCRHCVVKGSFPTDDKVNYLMKSSGFLRYFSTSQDNIKTNSDTIEIQSGNFANNQIVKNICLFVQDKLEVERTKTQKLYDIIFEMMLNTIHHAYGRNNNGYDNWLLFAKFYPEKSTVDFIFLDTGYGIPETVRKNKIEVAQKWLAKIGITDFQEHDIVHSALNGAFRTRTQDGYRGKGLPRVYNSYNAGYIQKLNIMSNKACITPQERYDLRTGMTGTLFFWTISKESINGKVSH
jgi:hypothetical protein